MAAALLAEGTTTVTNCPDILDVPLMADVLRGLGCEVDLDDSVVRITTPAEPKHHADFAAVRQFRASVCVLGPLVARCRRACRAARWRRHRFEAPRHASVGAAVARCAQHDRARLRGRAGRGPARCEHPARVPVGGGDREHPDGRRPRQGRDGHRQRGPRTRDRRPVQHADPDGREDPGCRHIHADHPGRPQARADHAPRHRRPDRRGDVGDRGVDDAR